MLYTIVNIKMDLSDIIVISTHKTKILARNSLLEYLKDMNICNTDKHDTFLTYENGSVYGKKYISIVKIIEINNTFDIDNNNNNNNKIKINNNKNRNNKK